MTDIVEQRHQLELAQTIVDSTVDAVLVITPDGTVRSANPAVQAMFGIAPDDLIGANVTALMPKDTAAAHPGYLRHYLETGQAKIIGIGREVIAQKADGTLFPVHLAVAEMRIGSELLFVGTWRDMTDIVEQRHQLELAQTIVDSTVDAVLVITPDGTVRSANPAVQAMFGIAPDDLIGANVTALMPKDTAAAHPGYLRHYLETGQAKIIGIGREVIAQKADGTLFPVHLAVAEMRIGSELLFVGTLRDITDMVKRENELNRSNRDLEKFAYVASHDLQSPARSILNVIQLLQDEDDQQERDELFALLDVSAARMQSQILGLLEVSRLHRKCEQTVEVDLTAVALQVVEGMEDDIAAVGGSVSVDSDLGVVPGSEPQLQLLLTNLVGNALKYRQLDTPPRVAITRQPSEQAAVVHLAVQDNGIGIPPEHTDRVFDIFQRLHPDDDNNYGGTGIGLSIVRRIAESHGGTVSIESAGRGHGTTVHLALPTRTDVLITTTVG